ncbi:hypothetical protein ABFG93_20320 [Pseudalkalibacillus hwajinpoensis]|uniref:hypothetical protein n=1 Tax=Guptibacillus hwajinpoensis TaxID=208199 RepID=UPI00325A5931
MLLRLMRLIVLFILLIIAETNLNLKSMTFTDIMLNSFLYGFGAICFLFGFLLVARIVREYVEGFISFGFKNKRLWRSFVIEIGLLIGVYWILFQTNIWVTLASLLMAFIYGTLSANIQTARALKRFRRRNEV